MTARMNLDDPQFANDRLELIIGHCRPASFLTKS
jgi:hypothetical protein